MKHTILSGLLLLSLSLACGQGATVPLETTPRTPAAVGTMKVSQGPNENTIGKLHVEHLAAPQELRGDLTVYVAWVRPIGEERWQNVGQLMVNDELEGSLELTVPHDRFDVAVSAESHGDASDPSEFIVMRGQVDSREAS
jgi:hypothetical protein